MAGREKRERKEGKGERQEEREGGRGGGMEKGGKRKKKKEETKKGKGRTHGRVKHGCIVQVRLGFWQAL